MKYIFSFDYIVIFHFQHGDILFNNQHWFCNPFPQCKKSSADDLKKIFTKIWNIFINKSYSIKWSWNNYGKWRNCSSWAISPFAHNIFKRHLLQMHQNVSASGKGIMVVTLIHVTSKYTGIGKWKTPPLFDLQLCIRVEEYV